MHQLGMGAHLQFALEQRQVIGDGLAADAQLFGNHTGRGAFGEHHENLQFALGHALQTRVAGVLLRVTRQLSGQGLFDVGVARENPPHRLDQHFGRRAFGQVTRSARLQCLAHQRQLIVHAEKQHAQLRQTLSQPARGFQPADPRQAEIHDHQIRHGLLNPDQRFFTRRCFTHFHRRQQRAQ
ncbi:hypothetical protein D3C84_750140 [compost metagenome]